jgi:hypothetical protein
MFKPSVEQLKKALFKKGYPIKTGEWELNLIGIRNDNAKPNSFDDTLCVLFKDHYGDDTLICFSCTTDAGLYWLLHPLNVDGCIIMKEGHYPDVYKVGLHRGYKALEQCGKIRYVRDNDKDAVLDFDAPLEVTGNFKTNIHHASMPEKSISVDKWSAGCQVINKGWEEFLELCEKSKLVTEKNLFSYTLININDVKYA